MKKTLFLLGSLLFLSGCNASFHPIPIKLVTSNILSRVYNFFGWLPTTAEYQQYYNDTLRLETLSSHLGSLSDASAFMFQEVSQTDVCLTNSSIELLGELEFLVSVMEDYGYSCNFGAHNKRHWSRYYDYENCGVYNSYRPVGNVICLKSSQFTNIRFYNEPVNNGSTNALADATFMSDINVTLASIHFDSDVAGIRRAEFDTTFFEQHPVDSPRITIACGDYNAGWESANLNQQLYRSGYTDPLYNYAVAMGYDLPLSQPLTQIWYSTKKEPIDHCVLPYGAGIIQTPLWKNNQSRYGYPDSTESGIIDFGLWAEYPDPVQGNDPLEPIRIGETLKRWGSDHYAVKYTIKLRI